MSRVIVVGAGIVGLTTALLLAADGVDVVVLDRDGGPAPGSGEAAWADWARPGVSQFRQPHYLQPGGFGLLSARLPALADAVAQAGTSFDYLSLLPDSITDRARRDGDERFVTVAARRPVLERAVAGHAESLVDIRRGDAVVGLVADGVPRVTGVRTVSGATMPADLVIDATGRRSALPAWLADLGVEPVADEVEDVGFAYYTRFFRADTAPAFPGGRLGAHFDCYSLLTLPGDADTYSVTVYVSARDRPMKELRDAATWMALVRSCPWHAHLLDGEPLTDIWPMGGVADRWRDVPVITGVVPVGDSVCTTNPALGRGITLGLMQAVGLADIVTAHLDEPALVTEQYGRMLRERMYPWYQDTVDADRARQDQIDRVLRGDTTPQEVDAAAAARQALSIAMSVDATAFRAMGEIVSMVARPEEVFARAGFVDHVRRVAAGREPDAAPGPSRAEVLELLA